MGKRWKNIENGGNRRENVAKAQGAERRRFYALLVDLLPFYFKFYYSV
jgi:hypothetical protein